MSEGAYAEFVVDLDTAIASLGLDYTSEFKIRFNHYDNNPAPDDGLALDDIAIVGDPTTAIVDEVTSSYPDGAYTTGEVIPVQVVFSTDVTVTGTPVLELAVGAEGRTAVYASGSGTNTLVFEYTVAEGDNSSDLDYASAEALSLEGGTIQTASLGDAFLTLPAPGFTGSLAANTDLVIDTAPPVVTVDPLLVANPVPTLTGTVEDGVEVTDLSITINGSTYAGVIDGSAWSVAVTNWLPDGTYDVQTDAEDAFGHSASDTAAGAVTIDTAGPAVGVSALVTGSTTPTVSGVATDPAGIAAVEVTVAGTTYAASVVGETWTADVTVALAEGAHDVAVAAADTLGNLGADAVAGALVVDLTPPVITVIGDDPADAEVNVAYVDAGATATDAVDGDVSGGIVVGSDVDTSALGSYTVTYDVSDSSGNAAHEERTVNVVDTTAPVITIAGDNPVTIEVDTAYDDAGATATDNHDGDVTAGLVTTNDVDTSVVGSYTVTYEVTDASGNTGHEERTVNVVDTTAPEIVVTGDNPASAEAGETYNDAGATASDSYEGDLTADIVKTSDVTTSVLGAYTVSYDVSDSSGNSDHAERTVNVEDTTAPELIVLGSNPVSVEEDAAYEDAGATALDSFEGSLTSAIVTGNPVDTGVIGTYTVTYDVEDSSGNTSHAERTVNVVGGCTILVVPSPSELDAPWTLTGPNSFSQAGTGSVSVTGLESGDYTVTWGAVSDWTEPDPETRTLAAGASITVTGAYERETGTVVVDVTPEDAPWLVTDGDGDTAFGSGSTTLPATATGTVSIEFFGLVGYERPAGQEDTLTADGTVTFEADYVPSYLTAERVFAPDEYVSPGSVDVTVTIDDTSEVPLVSLQLDETLPAGWVFAELLSVAPGTQPDAGAEGTLTFAWTEMPTFPVVLEYRVTVPEGQSGQKAYPSFVSYDRTGAVETVALEPDSITADESGPVITIIGGDEIDVEVNSTYTDAGATAWDNVDGDVTADLVTSGAVDTSVLGPYTISYDVSDSNGNASHAERTVNVVDSQGPVITVLGVNPLSVGEGSTYTDAGATAEDAFEGDLTTSITVVDTVNTAVLGAYTVTYTVVDSSGNTGEAVRNVTVIGASSIVVSPIPLDLSAPWTLSGPDGFSQSGSGATTLTGLNSGDYTLTWQAVTGWSLPDADTQAAPASGSVTFSGTYTRYTGTVTVDVTPDEAAWSLTDGDGEATAGAGDATVSDVPTGTVSISFDALVGYERPSDQQDTLDTDGTVDFAGAYVLSTVSGERSFSPEDYGSPGTVDVSVTIAEAAKADITSLRLEETLPDGWTFEAMVSDDPGTQPANGDSGTLEFDWTALPDLPVTLTYRVNVPADEIGARAFAGSVLYARSGPEEAVAVGGSQAISSDSVPPVLTIVGSAEQNVQAGTEYEDEGATAEDNLDGDITESIVATSTVDTSVRGTYTVTYVVSDSSGNEVQAVRTVYVVDTIVPTLTILGANPAAVTVGTTYTDAGATATDSYDGDITASIAVTNRVDASRLGSYRVVYDVSDSSGNTAHAERVVNVVESGACALGAVVVTQPVDGSVIIVAPTVATVPLTLMAETDCHGDTAHVVLELDAAYMASPSTAPYTVAVDDVLASGLGEHTVTATAFHTGTYGGSLADESVFTIMETDGTMDADGNGLPDNPFTTLAGDGDMWQSVVDTRLVAVSRWEGDGDSESAGMPTVLTIEDPANPGRRVTATVPAGLLAEDEIAMLVVQAAPTLAALMGAEQAALMAAEPAGTLVPGSQYVEVSVLITTDGGATFDEIDNARLAASPIRLTVEGVSVGGSVTAYSHPTYVDSDATTGLEILAESGAWTTAGITNVQISGATVSMDLVGLSVFAAYESEEGEEGGGCFGGRKAVWPVAAGGTGGPGNGARGDVVTLLLAASALVLSGMRNANKAKRT